MQKHSTKEEDNFFLPRQVRVIDFLIVAFCVFLLVKFVNKLSSIADKKKKEAEKKVETIKPADIVLLEEIRDLLKKQNKAK